MTGVCKIMKASLGDKATIVGRMSVGAFRNPIISLPPLSEINSTDGPKRINGKTLNTGRQRNRFAAQKKSQPQR